MYLGITLLLLICLQVPQRPLERCLIAVLVLPVAEVRNEVLSDFAGAIPVSLSRENEDSLTLGLFLHLVLN
jgi:hypothetical protein